MDKRNEVATSGDPGSRKPTRQRKKEEDAR